MKFGSTPRPDKLELWKDVKFTHRPGHPGVPEGPGIVGGSTKGFARLAEGDKAGVIPNGGVVMPSSARKCPLGRS